MSSVAWAEKNAPNLVTVGLVVRLLALALALGRIGQLLWILFPLGHCVYVVL